METINNGWDNAIICRQYIFHGGNTRRNCVNSTPVWEIRSIECQNCARCVNAVFGRWRSAASTKFLFHTGVILAQICIKFDEWLRPKRTETVGRFSPTASISSITTGWIPCGFVRNWIKYISGSFMLSSTRINNIYELCVKE